MKSNLPAGFYDPLDAENDEQAVDAAMIHDTPQAALVKLYDHYRHTRDTITVDRRAHLHRFAEWLRDQMEPAQTNTEDPLFAEGVDDGNAY